MKREMRIKNLISLALFGLGVLIAMALAAASALAEYEAVLFDTGVRAEKRLTTLYCPALISSSEVGEISIRLSNPSEYEVNPVIKARISAASALFIREEDVQVFMKPGEKQTLSWPVQAGDAAFKRLILVRVLVGPSYPLDSRTATCGIVVIDLLGLTSSQMQIGGILLSIILMITGWIFWSRSHPYRSGRIAELGNGLKAMALIALIGAFSSFTNWWIISVLSFATCLLLGVILFGRYGADVD